MSFCRHADTIALQFFNRGREIVYAPNDSIFGKPMAVLTTHFTKNATLDSNHVYHGEVISKLPRHNKTHYDRLPIFYFVLFDIQRKDTGAWLEYPDVVAAGAKLGLEVVQCFWHGPATDDVQISVRAKNILKRIEAGELQSMLGGDTPEGIVIKNPRFIKKNGKESATKVKLVRAEFKEAHRLKSPHVVNNEDANAICARIMACFPREARFAKAAQRLRDEHGGDETCVTSEAVARWATRDLRQECESLMLEYIKQELLPHMVKEWAKSASE
jgi:hypothetical protein